MLGRYPKSSAVVYLRFMHVSELDTPALLIDLDIFERNLCRVADYAKANDLRLRPHTKTHKVDRKSTRLNSSHLVISYAVFCLKKKKKKKKTIITQRYN